MTRMIVPRHAYFFMGWLAGLLLCASTQLFGQAAAPDNLPPGEGRDLLVQACTQCHGIRAVTALRDGPAGWKGFVHEMVLRGAQLTPQEADTLIDYLARNFGAGSNPAPGARKQTVSLPAGPGKELIESHCTSCHDAEKITSVKRTKADWDNVVKDMIARGAQASPDEIKTMSSYLSTQFGKDAK